MKRFFVICFFVFIVFVDSVSGVITGEVVTGHATSDTLNMSITVTGPSALIISFPENKTYLYNESLSIVFSSGADNLWYNLDNGNNFTLIEGTTFNVSEGSHTLYGFANNSYGITAENVTFLVNLSLLSILYSEFNGGSKGSSTDFINYAYEDLLNLSGIVLENINYGKIEFDDVINIENDSNPNDGLVDLDGGVNISFNRIEINSSALPNFNVSANLTFYGLSFTDPRVLLNGVVCPLSICSEISYSGGNFSFNVSNFDGVFTSEETPSGSGGDSGSSGGSGSASSGGSGGGISLPLNVPNIEINKDKIEIDLKQGESGSTSFIIKNKESEEVVVILDNNLPSYISVEELEFVLKPGERKEIFLKFDVSLETVPDNYVGKILVKSASYTKEIPVSLNVESISAFFNVILDVSKKKVYPGKKISVGVSIKKIKDIEPVDVTVSYILKDLDDNVVYEEKEVLKIEKDIGFVKKIRLPEDLEFGDYSLYVNVFYANKISGDSIILEVSKKERNYFIYLIVIILILVIVLFIQWKRLKKEVLFEKKRTSFIERAFCFFDRFRN